MTRLLPAVLSFVALMSFTGTAQALALAEAEMLSRLNQPLDVRVRLLSASAEELASMSVTVRHGSISAASGGTALRYELQKDGQGSFLRITTQDPVREPVIKMMVDVNWSKGRLLREYSLILDLKQP